jgi:hypothetical protein
MSETKSGEIYGALAAVMAEVGSVGKSRQNPQQGYKFRGIDDVMAHVQGVLAKFKVICIPFVVSVDREMVATKSGGTMASVRAIIDHTFFAADGSSVVARTIGEAMDSGDKASNKSMSAALKYALVEALMIPTYEVDRDTEEASPTLDVIAAEKASLLTAFSAAEDVASLDALWARVKVLPTDVVAELTGHFKQRKTALKKAVAV